jgi:FkbM family methyltransferase
MLRSGITIETLDEPVSTIMMFREIWQYKIYIKYYTGPSPHIVVDIGAHIGMFAIQAAVLWPHAYIHAYEPEPTNYSVLCKNIANNSLPGVSVYNEAACAHTGTVNLFIKQRTDSHSIYDNCDGESRQIQVKSNTLAKIVERVQGNTVDFLKMDCEGCEYNLIEKETKVFQSHVRYVVLEYHQAKTQRGAQEILNTLNQAGFSIIEWIPYGQKGLIAASNERLNK